MRTAFYFLVTLILIGCKNDGASPIPPVSSIAPVSNCSPTPLPVAPVSASNLSWVWWGTEVEPPAGPANDCTLRPNYVLKLKQIELELTGELELRTPYPMGRGDFYNEETFVGTNRNGIVELVGTEKKSDGNVTTNRYIFTFQGSTNHLTGTRNGKPFFLTPIVTPATCPPEPDPCGTPGLVIH